MLVPDRVSVPVPALVRLLAPEMTPESVASALAVIVASEERAMPLSIVVAPVTVRLPPLRVTAPLPRLLSEETESVPALTLVVPL